MYNKIDVSSPDDRMHASRTFGFILRHYELVVIVVLLLSVMTVFFSSDMIYTVIAVPGPLEQKYVN